MVALALLLPLQPELDAAIAISLPRSLIGLLNQGQQIRVWVGLIQASYPGIVGGARDLKETTHGHNRVLLAMLIDQSVFDCPGDCWRSSAWNFFSRSSFISSCRM